MNDIFNDIYMNKKWYDNSSGPGSTLEFNQNEYIPFIQSFVKKHNLHSIVDIGCGDCQCIEHIFDKLDVKYYGYDCSKFVITNNKEKFKHSSKYHFELLDGDNIISYLVKRADLIIIKDVLQHWSNNSIIRFLRLLYNKITFNKCLLINDFTETVMIDINNGEWRQINWQFFDMFITKRLLTYGPSLQPKEVVEYIACYDKDTLSLANVVA